MRPIKFRAWDKEFRKMSEPSEPFVHGQSFFFFKGYGHRSYIHKSLIIMQSTGLMDKDGVEIYQGYTIEGILFNARQPIMGEVVYDVKHTRYAVKNLAGLTPLSKIGQIEVIFTNFDDNPELLEKDNG